MTPDILDLFIRRGANVTVRFGGYFREVKEARPLGIMPLTRRLGDLLETTILPNPEELRPITARPVKLDYRRWGYASQAEMDAAVEGEDHD